MAQGKIKWWECEQQGDGVGVRNSEGVVSDIYR